MLNKSQVEEIDIELEKLVFLCNAEEGNLGLFELLQEMGYYSYLTIAQKHEFTSELLSILVNDGLLNIERFERYDDEKCIEIISNEKLEDTLKNHQSWLPSTTNVLIIVLTKEGNKYLDKNYNSYKERIHNRLFGEANFGITRIKE